MKAKWFVCLVVLAVSGTIVHGAAPSFQGLGLLSAEDDISEAYGVSADGLVVVGRCVRPHGIPYETFRWTQETGMVGLGFLPGDSKSEGRAASADGSVIVGGSASSPQAYRWTQTGGMVGLGDLPGGDFFSWAHDVSADGSVVVGRSVSGPVPEAFRWTQATGMVGLGYLAPTYSDAHAVSANGAVIVGGTTSPLSGAFCQAYRWTAAEEMVGLGSLSGGDPTSHAHDVSADGSVIVGESSSASYPDGEAFRWTAADGMVGLGNLHSGHSTMLSKAYGVSADGSVIVGWNYASSTYGEAFIWDTVHGMRSLEDVLVNECGLDLAGWDLCEARGVSADGLTIVGSGHNPNGSGNTEAWVATIPEPATLSLLALGGLALIRRRKRRA